MTNEEFQDVVIDKSDLYRPKGKDAFVLAIINGKQEFEVVRFYPDKEEINCKFSHPKQWGVDKCYSLMKEGLDREYNIAQAKAEVTGE